MHLDTDAPLTGCPQPRRPGDSTDESFTPPHGDPERAHLDREDDEDDEQDDRIAEMDNEGPGPAEGHTDNKAGG